MKARWFWIPAIAAPLLAVPSGALGQTAMGTAFTYQGQLKQAGIPVDDTADFQFTLWDDPNSVDPGHQVGSMVPVNNKNVVKGLFTVQLDFGADAFTGDGRWLEIAVRSPGGGGSFTTLSPRQELTPTPYTLYGLKAADAEKLGGTDPNDFALDTEVFGIVLNNDGSGSGLDADYLDGLNSTSFLRSDTSDAFTSGTLSMNSGTTLDVNGTLRMDGAVYKSGTGLVTNFNADLLDGQHASSFLTTASDYGRSGVSTTLYEGTTALSSKYLRKNASDDYTGTQLTIQDSSQLEVEGELDVDGLLRVDGTVDWNVTSTISGLDADKLDGQHGSAYLRSNTSDSFTSGTLTMGSGTTLDVNGTFYADRVYLTSVEYLGWDSAQTRFEFSDDVAMSGPIQVGSTSATPVGYSRFGSSGSPASGDMSTSGDVFVEYDLEVGDDFYVEDSVKLWEDVNSVGTVDTHGPNGNLNVRLSYLTNYPNHGYVAVKDSGGGTEAGMYVNSSGNGIVWGDTKNFRMLNPGRPGTEIWYACVEGPEAAAYIRGTGRLVNGHAVIEFPEHFLTVAVDQGMTVHVTPMSPDSKGLAATWKGLDGVVVEELFDGTGNYEFDYVVMAVRAGHEDYRVIRDASEAMDGPLTTTPGDDDERMEEGHTAHLPTRPEVPVTASSDQNFPDRSGESYPGSEGELAGRISELEVRLSNLEYTLDTFGLDNMSAELSTLREEIEQLWRTVDGADHEGADKPAGSDREEPINALAAENHDLFNRVTELEEALATLELDAIRGELATQQDQIAELQDENDELRARVETLERLVATLVDDETGGE